MSHFITFLSTVTLLFLPQITIADVRIKDVVELQGVRENQLVGYGLVIGLNGTGDSLRNAPFTETSIKSMLDKLGIGQSNADFRTKNVATVLVTANLPAFANKGTKIDINVSSIGDAKSLRGGTLVFTPLVAGDGNIYASAQGSLVVSGFEAEGDATQVQNNTTTAARIPNGAIVEAAAPGSLNDEEQLVLQLMNPDFDTAVAITDRINNFTLGTFRKKLAIESDHQSIVVAVPKSVTPTRFFASIGKLKIKPDIPAKIIVDERTGTVIIGSNVKISTVAITHGGLTVSIAESPEVSQPSAFSTGVSVVVPTTQIEVFETANAVGIVEGPNLRQLVNGLNKMGAKPTGIIAILQGIKSVGALHAELIVQ